MAALCGRFWKGTLQPGAPPSCLSAAVMTILRTIPSTGIRTSDGKKYIEYEGGFKELHDLKTDPYELNKSYDANASPADLATRLQALKDCAGATCRMAEGDRSSREERRSVTRAGI